MNKAPNKQHIKRFKQQLSQAGQGKHSIVSITQQLVHFTDSIITRLFLNHLNESPSTCLLALGSYGRCELQLYSDVDILLLHDNHVSNDTLNQAQAFIQDCWDHGFDISHRITTVDDFAELASHDLSTISSLLDVRFLCGSKSLLEELHYQTHRLHMWSSEDFFFAKREEQRQRYKKYGETAYNLEPNVKYGPGGLRDIQVLVSISKRHFGIKTLMEGIPFGFITTKEYEELMYCQQFLWQVRWALHTLAQRQEDRLLFGYQKSLAQWFGFQDTLHSLAIEQFMKSYFQVIKRSRELNEILLQWFSETIIHHQKQTLTVLDDYFYLSNNYIEVRHRKIFSHYPHALLRLFLWIAKNPIIKGVRASTIRLIREHLFLIDKEFCANPQITSIFMSIFATDHSPYEALHRMNRYGILSYYLEGFSQVTGQMQYDLFHVYTVDQHTLFVIRYIGRFLEESMRDTFPVCCHLMTKIAHRDVLYIAALFHDIAKGRGGDHSLLGAKEAQCFAKRHRLNQQEEHLLTWLVEHHLLLSHTAQRQDIYDPQAIQKFCSYLPHPTYLDYLYVLTVADVCATNPALWNAWKDSLLKTLYFSAREHLEHEKKRLDEASLVKLRQKKAKKQLVNSPYTSEQIDALWQQFKNHYFLHESPAVIARHTQAILNATQFPLILILPHHSEGGTEILMYAPHRADRFTITTTILTNHMLTIQEATISTCNNGFDLDIYIFLDKNNQALKNKTLINHLETDLKKHLSETKELPKLIRRRLSRLQAHFILQPKITFTKHPRYTELFLIAADRPGLLAKISHVFHEQCILIHNAKIVTIGERIEDTFKITTSSDKPLNSQQQEMLKQRLIQAVSA